MEIKIDQRVVSESPTTNIYYQNNIVQINEDNLWQLFCSFEHPRVDNFLKFIFRVGCHKLRSRKAGKVNIHALASVMGVAPRTIQNWLLAERDEQDNIAAKEGD